MPMTKGLRLGLAALGFLVVSGLGCRKEVRTYGEPVDSAASVPLAEVLAMKSPPVSQVVTVSGRIAQVCASAGCWFTLEDQAGGRVHQLLVDLKPAASFTLPTSVTGRSAVVKGRLVREDGDLQLNAMGLALR